MSFRNIKFGKASAEAESADSPFLLLEGYLDSKNYAYEAIYGDRFLFLGYKGSGKTALGEHLKLFACAHPESLFVSSNFLSDFPFVSFYDIVGGANKPESRFPTAWAWLLLILLIDSFNKDQNSTIVNDPDYLRIITLFQKLGILPAADLSHLALLSSKKTLKMKLPIQLELGLDTAAPKDEDLRFIHYINYLKKVCGSNVSEGNRHIIIIDGLDDILTGDSIQYVSIASLITEASRLNEFLRENNSPGKIVILCRTDLFERLPAPNKNKFRQDWAHEFIWNNNPCNPKESELIELANLRARLCIPGIRNIFEEFFPLEPSRRNIYSFLLNFTRDTPRDFLQLLVHVQKHFKAGRLTEEQLWDGINEYSVRYFLPEIKDELSGYLHPDIIEQILRIISTFGEREFRFDDFVKYANDRIVGADKINFIEVFRTLYDCSAIGNIDENNYGRKSMRFKNRFHFTAFDERKKISIHKAISRALKIIR
jgi:hypothetical protein